MDFRDIKEFMNDMMKYIITAFVVIFIVVYIVSVQQVVGPSMNPTLKEGDILILDKISYRYHICMIIYVLLVLKDLMKNK